MRTYVPGIDISIPVSFAQDGRPHVPDEDSATYTLLDASATPVLGHIDQSVVVSVNKATISLPAAVNEITTTFSKRTVVISYTVAGNPYEMRVVYRLMPSLNFTITPSDVRSYLGVNEGELRNDDVDLVRAYIAIQEEVGVTSLVDALSSGEIAEIRANEAILYWAALDLIPSLKLRVAQSEKDGPLSFTRPALKNFDELEQTTRARLTAALDSVTGRAETSSPLLITTNDADPITG